MQTKKIDTSKSEKAAAVAGKTWTILKSETTAFVIGLLCVIFGVYLLLAFSSFFFTGGNDQSILSHPNPSELLETGNRIQNYAGARGAQLAQFLINDCFGFSAYCIIIFLVVAGMKLMKAYEFRIRYWFLGCATVMVWLSVTLGFAFGGLLEDSYIYPGTARLQREPVDSLANRCAGIDSGAAGYGHIVRRGTDPTDHGCGEKSAASAKGQ